jgi:hypothetical protein
MPADMMPEAARERFAKPPAGTATRPASLDRIRGAPFDGRVDRSAKLFVGAVKDESKCASAFS